MKILIAEDDKASSEYLRKLLNDFGMCDVKVNGIETIDAFIMAHDQGEPYDIIFLDIMMPVYDGAKALQTIRKIEKQKGIVDDDRVKVFITSALNDEDLNSSLSASGYDAYLLKPIERNLVLNLMENLK